MFRDSSLERDRPGFAPGKAPTSFAAGCVSRFVVQDPCKPFTMVDGVVEHPVVVNILEYHVILILMNRHFTHAADVESGGALRASLREGAVLL